MGASFIKVGVVGMVTMVRYCLFKNTAFLGYGNSFGYNVI